MTVLLPKNNGNDSHADQANARDDHDFIDNKTPSAPGALTFNSRGIPP